MSGNNSDSEVSVHNEEPTTAVTSPPESVTVEEVVTEREAVVVEESVVDDEETRQQPGSDVDMLNTTMTTMSIRDSTSGGYTRSDLPTESSGSYRGGARIRGAQPVSRGAAVSTSSQYGRYGSATGSSESGGDQSSVCKKAINKWDAQGFAVRPGLCKVGSDSKVYSNHYIVNMPAEGIEVYQYDIQMMMMGRGGEKAMRRKEEMRPIFWQMVLEHQEIFGDNFPRLIYNDCSCLYVHGGLNMPRGQAMLKVVTEKRKEIKVIIKAVGVKRAQRDSEIQEERDLVISLIDAILTQRVRCTVHNDSKDFVASGHTVHYIQNVDWENPVNDNRLKYWFNIGKGLCAMTGLNGAIKINLQHERLLYNVDIHNSIYYKNGCNLIRFVSEIVNRNRQADIDYEMIRRAGMDRRQRMYLQAFIKGLSVYTCHTPNMRKYKIEAVSEKTPTTLEFQLENGRRTTVYDYFRDQYNIQLHPHLPLIQIKKKRDACIPMDVLFVDRDPQKYKGQPSEEQLANFIRDTAVPPSARKEMIEFLAGKTGSQDLQGGLLESDEFMKQFGVTVEQSMQEVECKFLPRPQLEFDGHYIDGPENGQWDLFDRNTQKFRKVLRPIAHPAAFQLIYVDDVAADRAVLPDSFKMLMHTLDAFGLPVCQDTPINFATWNSPSGWARGSGGPGEDRGDQPKIELTQIVGHFKEMCHSENPDIIPITLFVMPRKDSQTYSLIKYVCEIELRVFCQAILVKTYKRLPGQLHNNSTAHNMFLKITGKLGATHYRLKQDGTHKNWTKVTNKKEPVLFIGVDVTHPSAEERRNKEGNSIACIVGNIDVDAMQYRTSVRIQQEGEEMVVNMTEEITKRIAEFNDNTNLRPAHIVVFRDGVSETEFKKVLFEEKEAIESAFLRFSADNTYKPTITFIVSTKRHHTRFFATNLKDTSGPLENLRPGLLVEKTVVTKEYFDFYLLSHAGPMGTSRPTHYYVLYDDWNPSSAFWQTITYALSFMYVRCPKSVSLPVPVYYAHLASKRAAAHLKAFDYYLGSNLRGMSDWERNQKRTEMINCHLNGMIFV